MIESPLTIYTPPPPWVIVLTIVSPFIFATVFLILLLRLTKEGHLSQTKTIFLSLLLYITQGLAFFVYLTLLAVILSVEITSEWTYGGIAFVLALVPAYLLVKKTTESQGKTGILIKVYYLLISLPAGLIVYLFFRDLLNTVLL